MSRMRANKYNAKKTIVDGITFDSKAEARRYGDLKILQMAGEISGLMLQREYPLKVNGIVVCKYRADFVYVDKSGHNTIVEDVKGVRTEVYKLKKKLMLACYGIEILETK